LLAVALLLASLSLGEAEHSEGLHLYRLELLT
jgi:hypothetical protein